MTNKENIDNHQLKITVATLIVMILFIMGISFQFATWKSEISSDQIALNLKVEHIGSKFVDIRSDIILLNNKAIDRDIQLATINTKLATIETLLIDIKQDIRDK